MIDDNCTISLVRMSRLESRRISSNAKLSNTSMSSGSVIANVETCPGKSSSWLRLAVSLIAILTPAVGSGTRRR
jgi:hypothetical protein